MNRDENFEPCRGLLANSVDAYCAAGFSKAEAELILRLAGAEMLGITHQRAEEEQKRERQRVADDWHRFEEKLDGPLRDLAHQHRPDATSWSNDWRCASCAEEVDYYREEAMHWPCPSARLIRKLVEGES